MYQLPFRALRQRASCRGVVQQVTTHSRCLSSTQVVTKQSTSSSDSSLSSDESIAAALARFPNARSMLADADEFASSQPDSVISNSSVTVSAALLNPKTKIPAKNKHMPKHLFVAPHPRKVTEDRLRKNINAVRKRMETKPMKSKHVRDIEEAVKALQPPDGMFLAPLNPSPELNPLYGTKTITNAIVERHMPLSLREPLGGQPEAWLHALETLDKVDIVKLCPDLFNHELRIDLLHRYVHWQRACARQGTHKTKNRGEVRGGGRKPWPQKGTGRARAGSIRSPIWRGGGRAHPKRPQDYSYNLPLEVRQKAIKVMLSQKLRENFLVLIDSIPDDFSPDPIHLERLLYNKGIRSALILDGGRGSDLNPNLISAMVGVEKVYAMPAHEVGCLEMLSKTHLLITPEGLEDLTESLSRVRAIERYNAQVKLNIEANEQRPDVDWDNLPPTRLVRVPHDHLEDSKAGMEKLHRILNKDVFLYDTMENEQSMVASKV